MTPQTASSIPVHCSHDALVDITAIVANPRNPNKHPDKQVALLAKIIRHQGWRAPVVVSKRSGFVVAGHGRLEAAKLLQVQTVPVNFQEFATEADEWAHVIADNRIAELAETDGAMLKDLLIELDSATQDFDMDLSGFDAGELERVINSYHDEPLSEDSKGNDASEEEPVASHIRMVQLFLTTETHPKFTDDVTKLAARYQTLTITDTVVEAISRQSNLNEDSPS